MCATIARNTLSSAELDELCINTIRTLSIDAVQAAKSGHPGTPMALAPLVYTIWNRVLRFDPKDPHNVDADRLRQIRRQRRRRLDPAAEREAAHGGRLRVYRHAQWHELGNL